MSDAPAYLTDWILRQRWYSGKGSTGTWERIGGFTLESEPGVVVRVHLLLDHSTSPLLYQVPVTERTEPVAGLEYALIGEVDGSLHLRRPPRPRLRRGDPPPHPR